MHRLQLRRLRGLPLKELVRIGARGSPLSLAQTGQVVRALEEANPGVAFQVVPIRTRGDDPGRGPAGAAGVKGLFVKEIEDALLLGVVDLAVHSAKDLPSALPEGLALCAAPERASPFDALIVRAGGDLHGLRHGARIGTSSLRRAAQLLAFRPDFEIAPLRGNVDTRLGRVESGELDATLLGASGLIRLKGASFPVMTVDPGIMLPAPGQGQLGLEMREGDARTEGICSPLDHHPSALALACERAFMEGLGAGCQTPAACWARFEGTRLVCDALVCELDGSRVIRASGFVPGDRGVPGAHGVSGVSGDSGVSGVTADTGVGVVSGAPGVGVVSGAPGVDVVAGEPGVSGGTADTGVGGFPGFPGIVGGTGVRGVSEMSADSGVPEVPGDQGFAGLPAADKARALGLCLATRLLEQGGDSMIARAEGRVWP
ncbi:MAG: hydroxymethylbilane synthase [Deltaproteobacteria bacterium]|jgi:hydroxymethylbilane synthase|nr:hydroxymethylbilane synthase [Deltaproteobacteria bacterium]